MRNTGRTIILPLFCDKMPSARRPPNTEIVCQHARVRVSGVSGVCVCDVCVCVDSTRRVCDRIYIHIYIDMYRRTSRVMYDRLPSTFPPPTTVRYPLNLNEISVYNDVIPRRKLNVSRRRAFRARASARVCVCVCVCVYCACEYVHMCVHCELVSFYRF